MTNEAPVLSLEDLHDGGGGKARSLRWLLDHGYAVPRAVVVSPDADIDRVARGLESFVRPGRPYVVRSSADVEDGRDWSFAGQFTSVVDVSGLDAVVEAVGEVRRSSLRGDDPYAIRSGVEVVSMWVVVQEQVAAQRSGVSFSRNPMTGLDEIVIEEVDGLADGMLAGRASPHRWIRRWGEWTLRPPDRDDAVVTEVAEATATAAEAWGGPIDVEWAHDGERLHFLQIRPQTGGPVPVYSNRISKEVLPGLIKPLVWSVNIPIVNSAWIELFTAMIGPNDLSPHDLARPFAYRAYFNMGAVGDVFEALGMRRDLLEVLMGLEGGEQRPSFRPDRRAMRHLPRIATTGWRLMRYRGELEHELPELQSGFEELERLDLEQASDTELLMAVDLLADLCRRAAFANIVTPLLMNLHGHRYRRRAEEAGANELAADPAAGDPRLENYDPNPHLDRLAAEWARLSDDERLAVERDPSSLPGLTSFLERFGHLSDSGNDFTSVPWRETPDHALDLIRVRRPRDQAEPPASLLAHRSRRIAAEYQVAREHVSHLYTKGYGLHRPLTLEMGRRLVARGLLHEAEDIFYLTMEEVITALRGTGATAGLAEVCASRRADMERVEDLDMPEIIYGDDFSPAPATDPDRRLKGLATSRGIAVGPARIISRIGEHHRLDEGDVLVIPYSDVAWTAMFARAGGVVAEAGGMLSHSSIVARELGIPCVVSVPRAMSIPEGAEVRVDGYTGEVQWNSTP